jgi:hypothetical protein
MNIHINLFNFTVWPCKVDKTNQEGFFLFFKFCACIINYFTVYIDRSQLLHLS